jgi:hypothetical protein
MTTSRCDLAYAAGLIDGEGSIYFATGRAPNGELKYQAFIAIATCDEVLPRWMYERFGGSYAEVKSPSTVARGNRPVFKWQLSGRRNIGKFLSAVHRYLTLKRDQSDLMCEFCRLRSDGMSRRVGERGYSDREHAIVGAMKALHYTRRSAVDNRRRPILLEPSPSKT